MNTTVEAGIACSKCSHWEKINGKNVRVVVRHANVEEVRLCSMGKLDKPKVNDAADMAKRVGDPYQGLRDRIKAAAAKLPNVDRMRYAIEQDNTVEGTRFNFYQVDRPQHGKWEGYTFVKQFISDDLQRCSMSQCADVLEAIAADVEKASRDYGLQKKRCGKCHRKLTRDDSRRRGYGPDCAAMLGIDF